MTQIITTTTTDKFCHMLKKKAVPFAPGTLVRVSRKAAPNNDALFGEGKWDHGIKFGAVCEVLAYDEETGDYLVSGPLIDDSWNEEQWVGYVKLAKQATRKAA